MDATKLPQEYPNWDVEPIWTRYESLTGRKNEKVLKNQFEKIYLRGQTVIGDRALDLRLVGSAEESQEEQ